MKVQLMERLKRKRYLKNCYRVQKFVERNPNFAEVRNFKVTVYMYRTHLFASS